MPTTRSDGHVLAIHGNHKAPRRMRQGDTRGRAAGCQICVLVWSMLEATGSHDGLIHTWSLAVEEQYYVLFPLFLLFSWRLGKRWIISFLAVVAIISLAGAQYFSAKDPSFGFYLLPTRSWEILTGAFVAFYYTEHNIKKHKYWASESGSLLFI